MGVTYKELDELKKGDKVYIKPYDEIKETTWLNEHNYSLFVGIPLDVLEVDDNLCLVRDDKTRRTRTVPKYVIESIRKKHDQPEMLTRDVRPGDKVYLKSYEEAKENIHLSEGTWNQFCGKPLKVTELCAYTSDYDEEMCIVFDDDTGEYLKVQTHLISFIDEPEITSKVHHPNHYNQNGMEVWDVIKAFTSNLSGAEAFYAGNAIKYILRWDKKNGVEDLEKAKVYIDKIIEGRKEKESAN